MGNNNKSMTDDVLYSVIIIIILNLFFSPNIPDWFDMIRIIKKKIGTNSASKYYLKIRVPTGIIWWIPQQRNHNKTENLIYYHYQMIIYIRTVVLIIESLKRTASTMILISKYSHMCITSSSYQDTLKYRFDSVFSSSEWIQKQIYITIYRNEHV